MSRIYSELHHNIQTLFIEAGVDLNVPLIVSQTGMGDTGQSSSTTPDE